MIQLFLEVTPEGEKAQQHSEQWQMVWLMTGCSWRRGRAERLENEKKTADPKAKRAILTKKARACGKS